MRLLLIVWAACSLAAAPPNVVFILCDDLGCNDLHCDGRIEHYTPVLDKLASQGIRSTAAYSACPVCSPTRAAILSGKNPARLHLTTFLPGRSDAPSQKLLHPKIVPALPLEEVTLAERFKAAGYATACIGKWHLGNTPKEQGFDTVYAGKANTTPSATEGGKGEYDLAEKAAEFIRAKSAKPFFLYLAQNAPHVPQAAQRDLVEKYAKTWNPVNAAIVNTIDSSVGVVLSQLERSKLADNTIVIFTSDNGGLHVPEAGNDAPTHNSPSRAGKGYLYEGGIRIPLIIRGPGIPAGKTSDVPIVSTDWTPTLCAMCGIAVKETLDGIDARKILTLEALPARDLVWHFPHYTNQGGRPGGAVRHGAFKYIENYEDGSAELYNLAVDPRESDNLASRMPGLAEGMKTTLDAWKKDAKVQENTANPAFDAAKHKAIYGDLDSSAMPFEKTAAVFSQKLAGWRKAMNEAVKK